MELNRFKLKLNPWQAIAIDANRVNLDDLIDARQGSIVRCDGPVDECIKPFDIRERTEFEKRFYRYRVGR